MKIITAAYKKLLITFLALGTWLVGHSQQYPDSLLRYLEIAIKNNPSVQQKFTEYQAALQKIPQVGSLSDPELSLGVFLKPMELVSGNQVADIRLMQMFPWFGVLKSARDEMSLMANAEFEIFRDAKLQVCYDVQRTWYTLYKIKKEISITEKNIEILKTIERLAIVAFQTAPSVGPGVSSSGASNSMAKVQNTVPGNSSGMQGMASSPGVPATGSSTGRSQAMQPGPMASQYTMTGLADLYRIQIEDGELKEYGAALRNQYITITAQFNGYLNRHPETAVFVPDTINPDSLTIQMTSLPDSILKNNPMLSMAEFERQSYEARKKMVKNMGYPMIGLGLNYSIISKSGMSASSMNGKDMIMPMVSVTLPVYRKKYRAMAAEADLLNTSASDNYIATANSLKTEFYQAIQLYQDADRRIKLYNSQYQLTSKILDIYIKGFAASSFSLTDLLRVRQQTFDYELKQAEAIADMEIAKAWLRRLGDLKEIL